MRHGCYARVTRREGSVSLWPYLLWIQSIEDAVSRGGMLTVDPKVGGSNPLRHATFPPDFLVFPLSIIKPD